MFNRRIRGGKALEKWLLGFIVSGLLLCSPGTVFAQSSELDQAYRQGQALQKKGRYQEAIPFYQKALELGVLEFGPDHPKTAKAIEKLASTHRKAGNFAKAEPLYKRALTIWETAKGPGHKRVGKILNSLGILYTKLGRYDEAENTMKQSLDVLEKKLGTDHPLYAKTLDQLGSLHLQLGRFEEAEKVLKQALAVRERRKGPEHKSVGKSLHNLATLYRKIGRFAEAEDFYARALAIKKNAFGPDHPSVANTLNDLGRLQSLLGRFGKAETFYKLALVIQEKTLGANHSGLAKTLDRLGDLYRKFGRLKEAEKALERALAIRQRIMGPEHKSVGKSLQNLANLYRKTQRYAKAEDFYYRALNIWKSAIGPDHPSVAKILGDLGKLKLAQEKNAEAVPLLERALKIQEKALDPEHASVAKMLDHLGLAKSGMNRPAEAEPLFRRALTIREKTFGPNHPSVASTLDNLSVLTLDRGNGAEALDLIRRTTSIRRRHVADAAATKSEAWTTERRFGKKAFQSHLRILSKAMKLGLVKKDVGIGEGFEVVQLASASGAAKAVARMAARFAAGDDDLAKLVRDYQDAIDRWQALDKQLLDAVSSPPKERNTEAEAQWRQERDKLESLIAETDAVLAEKFPEYAAMGNPEPLSLSDVRNLLGEKEALLVYAVAKRQSYLWVIRRRQAAMSVLPVAAKALRDAVDELRGGLDAGGVTKLSDLPPFDRSAAHRLYKQIFAPAEKVLKGARHVFVVADGALQSLPLGVLVTEEPKGDFKDFAGYRHVPWLARKYALTTLPSVSSLRALRMFAKRARATNPFTGFGDPLLKGRPGGNRGIRLASLYRGALADVEEVRNLPPLPDTADELRALSAAVNGDPKQIYLRQEATEKRVKGMDLSNSRIVAFATHALVAGDLKNAEPALVLTPPEKGTALDDGLLTASEVAQLKLNADLVILSACNTAAGDDSEGAEGLSGLAKAFFYAGSRALLVSHWPVVSDAAVKLTTAMLRYRADNPTAGRAEALRRSMLALMNDEEKPHYAHPMFWAPFVVVGEGGVYAVQ